MLKDQEPKLIWVGIKIIDLVLYKLALKNKITLGQAKVLKALHAKRALSISPISKETGLSEHDALVAILKLVDSNIISEKEGIYFMGNFIEKISGLIRQDNVLPNKKKVALQVNLIS